MFPEFISVYPAVYATFPLCVVVCGGCLLCMKLSTEYQVLSIHVTPKHSRISTDLSMRTLSRDSEKLSQNSIRQVVELELKPRYSGWTALVFVLMLYSCLIYQNGTLVITSLNTFPGLSKCCLPSTALGENTRNNFNPDIHFSKSSHMYLNIIPQLASPRPPLLAFWSKSPLPLAWVIALSP